MNFITQEMIPQHARTLFDQSRTPNNFQFTLPRPYAEWQRELMTTKCKLVMTLNGTKTGKTLGGSGRVANFSFKCPANQGGLFRIVAPTYALSEITFKYLCRLFPATLPYQKHLSPAQNQLAMQMYDQWRPDRTEGRRRMVWRHNGAIIQCVHAKDPETTIEGERTHGNLLDEASKMPKQALASVLSTTSQTGGWIACTTTPRGKRHWTGQTFLEIKEHMHWCNKNGKPYERVAFQVPTWTSPYVKSEVIEYARRSLPERLFAQLYGAELVDDGAVFSGHMRLVEGPELDFEGARELWAHSDASRLEVVIGVDWARRSDHTVATAWTLEATPRLVGFIRLQGTTYREIITEVMALCRSFKTVHLLRHDRTGIGDVIDELLRESPFGIEGVVFTNESKAHMVQTLMMGFQDKSMVLPNWPAMLTEIDNFGVTSTNLGHFKFAAEVGHDDIVCSMMLGYSAAREMTLGVGEVRTIDSFGTSALTYDSFDDDF